MVTNMGKRSEIIIVGDLVYKTPLKYDREVFYREIGWLSKFGSPRFPKLLGTDSKNYIIQMNYCGEEITKENCPDDWEDQIKDILAELKKYNCAHNDITRKEILVLDGFIRLIDFGWASKIGRAIPEGWPINLGIVHRLDVHKFDDEYAIFESMKGVLEDI